ncbi:MAG: YybS family protein [Deltaproteobacteria bacterium]|nr:YybS family protein [Deltaproteobacteria bacterium]MBW1923325.1 YybS family protein [Deltaproteobacteria bacterium]MBW1949966.1 YybS family protein [Deltaproteobacteria bacterium]MBW2007911.1 YybS family protein [Deltaproteobacteria bacterium]MBW2348014.1 YybS family protein [Deltaproteobacteria bacterium]
MGCFVWAAACVSATALIPIAGPFFSLLTPLPFLYYATKLGRYRGALLAGAVTLTIGVLAQLLSFTQGVLFIVEFCLLGLALAELYRRKFPVGLTVFLGTAFMLVVGFVFLTVLAHSRGMGPLQLVREYLQANIQQTFEAYRGSGGLEDGKAAEFQAYVKTLSDAISRIYVGMMVVGAGFMVWLNVILSRPILRMGGLAVPDFGPLDRWYAPDLLVWALIVPGFCLFLPWEGIKWWSVNVLIVMVAVYVFHGLSILLFFLNKYKVPSWVRAGIYALALLQQLFLALFALAGIFDQWADFRKIRKPVEA